MADEQPMRQEMPASGKAVPQSVELAAECLSGDAEDFGGLAGIVLTANVRSIAFDPLRGTTTPAATVRVAARDGAAVHQVVNIMGRVRSCSPDRNIAGYRAC